uniref:Sulfhydryl oxidase n=1 Tax=Fundulus heteroclitus TaxID=8078 RepID=A0A3Q2QBF4_FUNHE
MARRCARATSRFTEAPKLCVGMTAAAALFLCLGLAFPPAAEAGLYTASDQIVLLSEENVGSVLVNNSAAVVAEFYASWCGHCISFSPNYKKLAMDIKEWKPAVNMAAVDCAAEENRNLCKDYKITGYPTVKFFHAYSTPESSGVPYRARDVRVLRQLIIDSLESHGEPWPPACPPLEPTSEAEIDNFFKTNSAQHLALIFEDAKSYVGREVTLDLLQFENITVRRVLNTEDGLVAKLGVTDFPSCYLYYPDGSFTRLRVRHFTPPPPTTPPCWRAFCSISIGHFCSMLGDGETTLKVLHSERLQAHSKMYAKYFPGRPMVMNLLRSLNSWLQNQTADHISYEAFKERVDNTAQVPDAALPEGVRWVGCQGSQPHFRRYPCGVWTLFHVLTVQANNTGGSDPQEVLKSMRNYVHNFFGCRYCAEHFENMVKEGMEGVTTLPYAVLWLWSRHNQVNNRIAGALSEDPLFPKIQWPSPETCPSCHTVTHNGEHGWNYEQVLPFLGSYFSSSRILPDYLENEGEVLKKQREKYSHHLHGLLAQKRLERIGREASNHFPPSPSSPVQEGEEWEEEEGPQDETGAYEEDNEGGEEKPSPAASEVEGKPSEPTPWTKTKLEEANGHQQAHRIPSIIGMRLRQRRQQEDIVDLDLFENQHFKAKALQLAASSRVKQRTLQTKVEQEPRPAFSLGMELDAGLGMVGLQPIDADLDLDTIRQRKRLQKRELAGQYIGREAELAQMGRWMSVLSIGFSNVDISLCVILYALSFTCLLAMCIFFRNRFKRRRVKVALP